MARGGNDILHSIERYFNARCELLSKMKEQVDLGDTFRDLDSPEHLAVEQRRQLRFMDDRQLNRLWLCALEVQSSATGLYRLLQTALYPGSPRSTQ